MKICFLSGSDTGSLASIMKKYMSRLGHEIYNIVWERTYTDRLDNIDFVMLGKYPNAMRMELKNYFEDIDFFLIRNMNDYTFFLSGIESYLHKGNFAFKVHGSDLRARGYPFRTEIWETFSYAPLISFMELPLWLNIEKRGYYHIERPCDFETIPSKDSKEPPPVEVFHCTTKFKEGTHRGTSLINDKFKKMLKKYDANLNIVSNFPYDDLQKLRAKCHISIDALGATKGITGYYGLNACESWYQEIPVMMMPLSPIVLSIYPELEEIIIPITPETIEQEFEKFMSNPLMYEDNAKTGKEFVKRFHNPERIAKQYIHIFESIMRE